MSDIHHHDHSPEIEAMKKSLRPQVERDERYWRSLEQWGKDPEFQKLAEQEFMSSPLREEDREDDPACGPAAAVHMALVIASPVRTSRPASVPASSTESTTARPFSTPAVNRSAPDTVSRAASPARARR